MIRTTNAATLLMGLVMFSALPALARHEDDGALARARRELAEAERAYHLALADVSRARASLDAAQSHRAHVSALLDAAARNAQSARVSVDLARRELDRVHAERAQLERDLAVITRNLDSQRLRVQASRRHAESTRGRLVAEFESSRWVRDATAAQNAARERAAHVQATLVRYVQDSPHYRHLNGDVQHHRAQVERLERGWFVDRWRLSAAKRALGDTRQRRDEYVSRTVEVDPQVLAARADATRAQSHLDQLRDRFSRDLDRHPQLHAAQDAVAREDATLHQMQSDLATARERCAALSAQLAAQHRTLAAATHDLQCAEAEITTRQRDIDQASATVYAAQAHLSRAAASEQQARANRDRAARRVAQLENVGRIDDRRGNERWHDDDHDDRERGRRFRDD